MMRKKRIARLMLLVVALALMTQTTIAQDSTSNKKYFDYHVVLKVDEEFIEGYDRISSALYDELFDALKEKADFLDIEKIIISQGKNNILIISCKTTTVEPKEFISVIQSNNLPIPITVVAFFDCNLVDK
jgi:hypothetical protein